MFTEAEEQKLSQKFNPQLIADLKELHKRYVYEAMKICYWDVSLVDGNFLARVFDIKSDKEFAEKIDWLVLESVRLSWNGNGQNLDRATQLNQLKKLVHLKELVKALKTGNSKKIIVKVNQLKPSDEDKKENSLIDRITRAIKCALRFAAVGAVAGAVGGIIGGGVAYAVPASVVGGAANAVLGGFYGFFESTESALRQSVCNTIHATTFYERRARISTGTLAILAVNNKINKKNKLVSFIDPLLSTIDGFLPPNGILLPTKIDNGEMKEQPNETDNVQAIEQPIELDYVEMIEQAIDKDRKDKRFYGLFSSPSKESCNFIQLFNENKNNWKNNQKLAENAMNDYVKANPETSLSKILYPLTSQPEKYSPFLSKEYDNLVTIAPVDSPWSLRA